MQFNYVKTTAVSVWILAMAAIGILSEVGSPAGWATFALLTAIPPAVVWQFWSAPSPSMSETIQKTLR
jgi:hypothetical protein